MAGVILDSDVLIWWLRGREDVVEKIKAFLRDGEKLYITPVNVAEIWAGLRKNEERKVKMIFEVVEVLNIDFEVGRLAGDYLNKYRKSHGVELADALIAACVDRYDMVLWTFNRKHYPMLKREDILE